jgi:hypothetical protein
MSSSVASNSQVCIAATGRVVERLVAESSLTVVSLDP